MPFWMSLLSAANVGEKPFTSLSEVSESPVSPLPSALHARRMGQSVSPSLHLTLESPTMTVSHQHIVCVELHDCGDGGRKAECLLGLLDLPNVTTVERKTFLKIENAISPFVAQDG